MEELLLEYFYRLSSNKVNNSELLINIYNLLGSSSFFIFDLHSDKCIYISSSIKKITGYKSEFYLNKGIYFFKSLIHPLDYPFFICEVLTHVCKDKEVVNKYYSDDYHVCLPFRLRHKNNYWVTINMSVYCLYNGSEHDINALIGSIKKVRYLNEIETGFTSKISSREKEVLELISDGYSSKIIAARLNISETTAISHRKNLIHKLNVKNTAELIKEAVKSKIIT